MLSVKENKVLNILMNDARISRPTLAKKVGMSRELVEYHLKKLKEKGFLVGSQARINLTAFSTGMHNLFLKVSEINEKQLVGFLSGLKYTHFVAKIAGEFDYIIGFSVKKRVELKDYVDSIYDEFGDVVLGHDFLSVTEEIKNDFSVLFGESDSGVKTSLVEIDEVFKLDNVDRIILKELSRNAWISNVDLAGRCRISATGVSDRIRKLVKQKLLLGFIAEIDFMKLDTEFYYVYFSLKSPNKKNVGLIRKRILGNDNIVFGNQGVGGNSFLCCFYAKSNRELHEKFVEFCRGVDVRSRSVFLILDFLYQKHLPEGFLD